MTKFTSAERSPIYMIDTEADALSELAISAENRLPQVSELLLDEISRAIYPVYAKTRKFAGLMMWKVSEMVSRK